VRQSMSSLHDVLIPNARVLLVGINPSLRSAHVGHHFAGHGNPFWRLLYVSRLVPVPLTFTDDIRLPEFGLALTNLCPRATRSASELGPDEIERGKRALIAKIRRLRPMVVAFVGVSIYRHVCGGPRSIGVGVKTEKICGASVFVLPNPSGRNASFPGFEDKLVWFKRLREFVESKVAPNISPRLKAEDLRWVHRKRQLAR
jgi:double-stranded uracil-DNA glycosylase